MPSADGYSTTVTIDGEPWRSYVARANTSASEGATRLQVLQSLSPVQERLVANERLIALVTVRRPTGSGE